MASSSFASALRSRLPCNTSCLTWPQTVIRHTYRSLASMATAAGSPARKSIQADVSTRTLQRSAMAPPPRTGGLVHLDALHLAPVEIHETAAGELHEFVHAFLREMAFHGAPDRFGPADVRLGPHQFVHQAFIDRDCRSHT